MMQIRLDGLDVLDAFRVQVGHVVNFHKRHPGRALVPPDAQEHYHFLLNTCKDEATEGDDGEMGVFPYQILAQFASISNLQQFSGQDES